MKKCAVLTSNMQIATANKHAERKLSMARFLPKLIIFLKKMREAEIPIIHLQLAYQADDPKAKESFGSFPPLLRGTEGVKLLPEIVEANDLIIEKSRDSGFFKTTLEDTLKELNVKALIITGMQAHTCVQFTAADAFFRGFEVIINSETIGSTRLTDTLKAIECMKKYCAKILSTEQIFLQLETEGYI